MGDTMSMEKVAAHLRASDRLLRRLADLLTESVEFGDWPEAQKAVAAADKHVARGRRL